MGWFADYVYIMCYLNLFSSPSGDGLVLHFRVPTVQHHRFSSPSGDGLVPVAQYIFDSPIGFRPRLGMGWFPEDIKSKMQYFRPRLGMGWFISISLYVIWFRDFRPRLGMGWFRILKVKKIRLKIFVPEWGWVGSYQPLHLSGNLNNFRPRVGMGWFAKISFVQPIRPLFSSPLGDGLVQSLLYHPKACFSFSSPSGDGLVRVLATEPCPNLLRFSSPSGDGLALWEKSKENYANRFRPRVGMGWLAVIKMYMKLFQMFSSPSGDGLVRIVAGSMEQSSFSSPLGDGLVLQILTEILKN